jgi:hypothetical protein
VERCLKEEEVFQNPEENSIITFLANLYYKFQNSLQKTVSPSPLPPDTTTTTSLATPAPIMGTLSDNSDAYQGKLEQLRQLLLDSISDFQLYICDLQMELELITDEITIVKCRDKIRVLISIGHVT